jgi:DNA polymerase subunit Cdc27
MWTVFKGRPTFIPALTVNIINHFSLMKNFLEDHRADKRVNATYWLMGIVNSEEGDGDSGHFGDNDYDQREECEERSVHKATTVCRQEELEDVKARRYREVQTCSIFSVQAKPVKVCSCFFIAFTFPAGIIHLSSFIIFYGSFVIFNGLFITFLIIYCRLLFIVDYY